MSSPSQDSVDSQTRVCVLVCRVLAMLWATMTLLLLGGFISLPHTDTAWPATMSQDCVYTCLAMCATVSTICFLAGQITGNVSQVDKLWSIVPVLYMGLIASQLFSLRLLMMFLVSAVWGSRLTYNFWRRGGYTFPPWAGAEDYRWAYVRKWPVLNTGLGWLLFNLLFISVYQHLLLLALVLPAVPALHAGTALNALDVCVTITILALVFIEAVADQQQEEFQNEKWRRIRSGETLEEPFASGFISSGLFSLCRHPNYVAEQLIWAFFYLYSTAATGQWINPTMGGSLLLFSLFQGSTMLSESITQSKYAGYRQYQLEVPMFCGNLCRLAPSYKPMPIKQL